MDFKPIIPFEPISTDRLPSGENWIAQIKWDGVRMLTYYDGRKTSLINRRLNDRTLQYPELLDVKSYCSSSSFILDGEFIAFDNKKPSFHEIMKRDSLRNKQSIDLAINQTPVTYMIFDILYYNGDWLNEQPLTQRYQILEQIINPQPHVQVVQNFYDANALYAVMIQHEMEGVVCKDLTSTYAIKGKDKRWQKKKIFRDLFAVIGGVTLRNGIVNALLLGLYNDDGELIYIGHAGTGKFSNKTWLDLTQMIRPIIIQNNPFSNQPERNKDAIWVKPEIVVKVKFMEWTLGKIMRHPSVQAIVNTPVSDCSFPQNQ
ncbi:RNA ligase family protein [Brevibacillus choshinensis]|uniref:DNA ligase (ATP) n=1 Tax=Brevibacillus choshinensis TaxID=54911 RepID=A0ABX7FIY4_BRECH|nr:RNA ligase family protein [Brevibacillus choshinensis]QRG65570.1 DNA ligase [Brevibacillus choshinensis]